MALAIEPGLAHLGTSAVGKKHPKKTSFEDMFSFVFLP